MTDDDLRILALVKGKERYLWIFRGDRHSEVLRSLGRFASDADLSFTWFDAALLSSRVMEGIEQR